MSHRHDIDVDAFALSATDCFLLLEEGGAKWSRLTCPTSSDKEANVALQPAHMHVHSAGAGVGVGWGRGENEWFSKAGCIVPPLRYPEFRTALLLLSPDFSATPRPAEWEFSISAQAAHHSANAVSHTAVGCALATTGAGRMASVLCRR